MLNLENIILNGEKFVQGSLDIGNYYVFYQESSQECGLDYSIIKKDDMSLYDGGLLTCEESELTFADLIEEIKGLCKFREEDIVMLDDFMTEELSYVC